MDCTKPERWAKADPKKYPSDRHYVRQMAATHNSLPQRWLRPRHTLGHFLHELVIFLHGLQSFQSVLLVEYVDRWNILQRMNLSSPEIGLHRFR